MCYLDGRNHSSDELSGGMSTYDISSEQGNSRYSSPSSNNYQSSRVYGG